MADSYKNLTPDGHFAEPWIVDVGDDLSYVRMDLPGGTREMPALTIISTDYLSELSDDAQKAELATYRRIAACVNACKGIPTERLQSLALGDLLDVLAQEPAHG